MKHQKIVVIEKDKILKSILELFIEQLEHEVVASFLNFKEGIDYIQKNEVHTLIIDLNAFDNRVSLKDYMELIESLDFPILFIGNSDDIDFAKELISFNIYSFMSKPVTKNILKINMEIAYLKHIKITSSQEISSSEVSSNYCKVNSDGKILEHSNAFTELFNNTSEELTGKNLKELFFQNQEFIDFKRLTKKLNLKDSKKSFFFHLNQVYEALIHKESDDLFLINLKKSLIDNELIYHNQQLNAQFDTIFENSSEATIIFDADNKLVKLNEIARKRYKRIIGHDLHPGLQFNKILNFIPKNEIENILDTISIPATHHLSRVLKNKGKEYSLRIKISPIATDENNSIGGYILSSTELSNEARLQKEIATLKSELKPLYENTIQRFYLIDRKKKIVAFNESALKIIQEEYNHTLQKGDSILQFVPKDLGENKFNEFFEKVLQGEHLSFKNRFESELGTNWNEVHYEPVISENGELDRVLIWTLDITESEKNLIALKESNNRYELIAKGGNDGLWDWDIKTNEVYLSPRWKSLLGYDIDEIENEFGVRDTLTHPDDKKISEKALKKSFENKSDIFQNEIRLLCKDQTYKWVIERGIIQRDRNDKPYRLAGTITDITDRKKAEENLISLNQAMLDERSMFTKGNVGVIRADIQDITNVTYVSENTVDIIGYSPQEFYNKEVPFKEMIHPDDRKLHVSERKDALKDNQQHIDFTDYRLIKKDRSIIWVKDFTSIIRDDQGNPISLLGYIIDVTKEKMLEAEYENIQNMFSAIWQSLNTETFVVQNSGLIIFSRNKTKFSLKKLLDKDYFIFDHYSSLIDWGKIEQSIQKGEANLSIKENIGAKEFTIKINKIDRKRLLITTNITIDSLDV